MKVKLKNKASENYGEVGKERGVGAIMIFPSVEKTILKTRYKRGMQVMGI